MFVSSCWRRLFEAVPAWILLFLVATGAAGLSNACEPIDRYQQDCMASGQKAVNISCNTGFKLEITDVVVYQLSSVCTPSTTDSSTVTGSCQVESQSKPKCTQSTSQCIFEPELKSSVQCTGSYVVLTKHRCMPVFGDPREIAAVSTGSSLTVTSTVEAQNHGIALANGVIPNTDMSHYFSVYVPPGLQVAMAVVAFIKLGSQSCDCRVEVTDSNKGVVAQFCNQSSPDVVLGCSSSGGQFLRFQYVSTGSLVSAIYVIQLSAPQTGQMIVRAGTPPFPLFNISTASNDVKSTAVADPTAAPETVVSSVIVDRTTPEIVVPSVITSSANSVETTSTASTSTSTSSSKSATSSPTVTSSAATKLTTASQNRESKVTTVTSPKTQSSTPSTGSRSSTPNPKKKKVPTATLR